MSTFTTGGVLRAAASQTLIPIVGDYAIVKNAHQRNTKFLSGQASNTQKVAAVMMAVFKALAYAGAAAAITMAVLGGGLEAYVTYAAIGTGAAVALTFGAGVMKFHPFFNKKNDVLPLQQIN